MEILFDPTQPVMKGVVVITALLMAEYARRMRDQLRWYSAFLPVMLGLITGLVIYTRLNPLIMVYGTPALVVLVHFLTPWVRKMLIGDVPRANPARDEVDMIIQARWFMSFFGFIYALYAVLYVFSAR